MKNVFTVIAAIFISVFTSGIGIMAQQNASQKQKMDFDMQKVERGRYLSMTSGCNDCHTPGYMFKEGNVPEENWLTGESFGWRGPWGTTYATNLRLSINKMTEEQWVQYAKTLKSRPPMPWFNLNKMTEEDLKSIYRFIRYLGPAGAPAPAYVPPDQEPTTPFALFPSPPE